MTVAVEKEQATLTEPPVEEVQEAERRGTVYVLLQGRPLGDDEVFVVIDKREAGNGSAAKRAYVEEQLAEGNSLHGASLVAVPERSWEPEPVVIEQRIKIG